jgi:glycerol-3-phosphate acyltransferase PlsY
MDWALWIGAGYLLGSIPFGVVIAWALGLGDLRQIGSGNIGATNVLRTGNKPAAAATLVLDASKGAVAVGLATGFGAAEVAPWAGLAAFAGHCFPVWLRFNGGKGVATFLGTVLALAWPVGLLCCLTWLAAAALVRISSVGALAAAASAPVWMGLWDRWDLVPVGVILAALIYWRHGANIARLRAGTEPKIGQSKG